MAPTKEQIREQYLANQLFLLGEKLGHDLEVIDRRANYIVVVDGKGETKKMFLDEAFTIKLDPLKHFDSGFSTHTTIETARASSLTHSQAEAELHQVWHSHYADTSKFVNGYDGPDYHEMVAKFAADPFYKLHHVAKEYLKSPEEYRKAPYDLKEGKLRFTNFVAKLDEGFVYKGYKARNFQNHPDAQAIFEKLAKDAADPYAVLSALKHVDIFFEKQTEESLGIAKKAVAKIDDVAKHTYLTEASLTSGDMPFRVEDHPVKDGVNPTEVIHKLRGEYACVPSEINNGLCDDFANKLIGHIGGSVWSSGLHHTTGEFNNLPTHDFVEHKGKFYDAETPDGVDAWHQLPVFKQVHELHTNVDAATKAAKKIGPHFRKLDEDTIKDEEIDFQIEEKLTYSTMAMFINESFENHVHTVLDHLDKNTGELDKLADQVRLLTHIAHHYDHHTVHMKESAELRAIEHAEPGHKISLGRLSSGPQLVKVAKRAAVELIAQRLANKPVKKISNKEKDVILDAIRKKKTVVMKLARKLVPKIRRIEHESGHSEEFGSAE